MSDRSSQVAAFAAIAIGSLVLFYWVAIPVALGSLADTQGYREDQLGYVAGAYSIAFASATFLSLFWVGRARWSALFGIGATLMALGFSGLFFPENYRWMLIAHASAGFGTGVVYAVITVFLASQAKVTRYYALVFFFQVLAGGAGAYLLPRLVDNDATLRVMASLMLGVVALVLLLGRHVRKVDNHSEGCSEELALHWPSLGVAAGLLSIVLVYTGDAGVYVFLERLGTAASGREFGGSMVGVNLVGGALGSLIAAWLADRAGFLLPMIAAIALSLFSLIFLLQESSPNALLFGALLNGWAWNFGAAYRMALVATLDHGGSFAVLIPSMQTLGNALGPTLVGGLLVTGGYQLAFAAAAVLWLMALGVFYVALRSGGMPLLPRGRA